MSSENNKRIAKNSLMLYFRQILILLVSLYTVRVVLDVLGAVDYGIHNVVAGVVAMFAFLNGAMTSATERFFAFELGRKNYEELKRMFNITIVIYTTISIIILLLCETIGIWFINTHLNIPLERIAVARNVFHLSIFSFMITIISVPYKSIVIANERMNVFAYISIIEVLLKLMSVYLLIISPSDKLQTYALFNLIATTIITLTYGIYCRWNFIESKFSFYWDSSLFKRLAKYTLWNLIGNLAVVLKEQGTNILLNIFFSPIVNSARAIAFQVNTALISFVTNFQMAINPQIVKSYSSSDFEYYILLINKGARYTYYLLLLLTLPIMLGTKFILSIWLKDIPEHTISFVQLMLIASLIDCLYRTVLMGHLAIGRIKLLQLIVGGINLFLIPVCYIFLKLGFKPESVFIIGIFFSTIGLWLRLILFKKVFSVFSIRNFVCDVILNVAKVTFLSIMGPLVLYCFIEINSFANYTLIVLSSIISVLLVVYIVGLDNKERAYIQNYLLNLQKKSNEKIYKNY